MTIEIKLAKLNHRHERDLAMINLIGKAISNPIIELVGGFVLVETLQRFPEDRPIIGNLQGNLMEAGIGGIITVQQLAPILPDISRMSGDTLKLLAPLAAALAVVPK